MFLSHTKEKRKPRLSFLNSNRNQQPYKIISNDLQEENNNNETHNEPHKETHNETPNKIYHEKINNIVDINDIETISLDEIPKTTLKPVDRTIPDDKNRWYNIFKRRKSRKVSPSNYRAGKKTKRRKNRTKRRKNINKKR